MFAICAFSSTKPRMKVAEVLAKDDESSAPAITVTRVAAAIQRLRHASATSGIRRYGLQSATPIVAAITHGEPASARDIARKVIAIVMASGENDANMKRVIGRSATVARIDLLCGGGGAAAPLRTMRNNAHARLRRRPR